MSRIGKKPVPVPDKVKVAVNGRTITVEGAKSKLSFAHRPEVAVRFDDKAKEVVVERSVETREARAYHGLTRALIQNMITGVTTGYSKELEINGVGWQAQLKGKKLVLTVGFANQIELEVPQGVTVEVQQNRVKVSGPDKQAVGQFASKVRAQRKPEPYNGKGIKYVDEKIIRKAGKAFASGGA